MKDVNLSLKIEEINLVLTSLGSLPFIQVHELIGKIQGQATAQLTANNGNTGGNGTSAANGGVHTSMQLENN
jgi:hypothetical protein